MHDSGAATSPADIRETPLHPADRPATGDPPPPPEIRKPRDLGNEIRALNSALLDAYFPYDRAEPLPEGLAALRRDAELIRVLVAEFPGVELVVEGHCDERGSAEYNLGLGDRRARRAAAVLAESGVPSAILQIVSYGKEMPQCSEANEVCRQSNRRVHLKARPAAVPGTAESSAGGSAEPDPSRQW